MKDLGSVSLARWRTVLGHFLKISRDAKTRIYPKKDQDEVQTYMNPNARHFETELQAQAEATARRTANVHSEANVVAATAL